MTHKEEFTVIVASTLDTLEDIWGVIIPGSVILPYPTGELVYDRVPGREIVVIQAECGGRKIWSADGRYPRPPRNRYRCL